jgi:uncharacterized protein
MNIDLTRLNNNIDDKVIINQSFEVPQEYFENTDLIGLENVKTKGIILKDEVDYELNIDVEGMMILKCSITLEPVHYPFNIKISGKLEEIIEETSGNIKKNENTIDIFPIIWENILVEIPMKVVSENAKNFQAEGEGWKLITENEPIKENNPELEKLKKLL